MTISQAYILVSIIVLAVIVLLVLAIGKRGKDIPINKTFFAIGLLIVGVTVVLLLMDVIESGVAAAIGFVGIGLIAARAGHPFITVQAMHDTRKFYILRLNADPDLLQRFTRRRGEDGLIPIQVPGRDAVLAIRITGVEAAAEQYLIFTKEKQVDGNGKSGAHGCWNKPFR